MDAANGYPKEVSQVRKSALDRLRKGRPPQSEYSVAVRRLIASRTWKQFARLLVIHPVWLARRVVRWFRLRSLPIKSQLAVACTVYAWESAQMLEVYQPGNINGVPDNSWFLRLFNFSDDDLVQYIERTTGLIDTIIRESGDQRCTPASYITAISHDTFEVAIFDSDGKHDVRTHHNGARAAADFVLSHWGLRRLR
jgi:hypothetical protein